MPLRVRHHTSDEGLAGIIKDGGIRAGRGWGRFETGVHVEVEPFKFLWLRDLHPTFVKVRYHWWQWWRTKVE